MPNDRTTGPSKDLLYEASYKPLTPQARSLFLSSALTVTDMLGARADCNGKIQASEVQRIIDEQ